MELWITNFSTIQSVSNSERHFNKRCSLNWNILQLIRRHSFNLTIWEPVVGLITCNKSNEYSVFCFVIYSEVKSQLLLELTKVWVNYLLNKPALFVVWHKFCFISAVWYVEIEKVFELMKWKWIKSYWFLGDFITFDDSKKLNCGNSIAFRSYREMSHVFCTNCTCTNGLCTNCI